MKLQGRSYAAGEASGRALVLAEPLSFWGGIDPITGAVIDRSHPDLGKNVAGRVLAMSGGRGSSSSSAILAEAIRLGTAPAAILLATPDPILTVGAIVAQSLYQKCCPIAVCAIDGIASGDEVQVAAFEDRGAEIRVSKP